MGVRSCECVLANVVRSGVLFRFLYNTNKCKPMLAQRKIALFWRAIPTRGAINQSSMDFCRGNDLLVDTYQYGHLPIGGIHTLLVSRGEIFFCSEDND